MSEQGEFRSEHAFVFGEPGGLFDELEEMEKLAGPLLPALLAFKSNVASALQVGNIPAQLTHRAVLEEFNRLFLAERIRALSDVDAGDPSDDAEARLALQKARARFLAANEQQETRDRRVEHMLRILDTHLEDEEFKSSAKELLRQLLVMHWSAFEVLVNDTLRQLLNRRPALIGMVARSKLYRELFTERRLLDSLEDHDFDLSGRMGDFFCDSVRLDSLEKIREAVHASLDDGDLEKRLKDERLWQLSQQRHLIVHRRGLVDSRYIEKTGDAVAVGQHLVVDPEYVEACLVVVVNTGCAFYRVAMKAMEG